MDLPELPKEMFYPTFELAPGRGIIPKIHLPNGYKELVLKFYDEGRKKDVEDYAKGLEGLFKELEIRLNWDEKRGLSDISLGGHHGLDLNEEGFPNFQEHNLGMIYSFIAGSIAMKYISELLKSE